MQAVEEGKAVMCVVLDLGKGWQGLDSHLDMWRTW